MAAPPAQALALRRVRWPEACRIVPTRYPAINLFDRVADADDFDALYALEAMTNERSRDELGDVSRAFDEMAERVAALLRAERELLANVSHELRTPLSRIRIALALVADAEGRRQRHVLLGGERGDEVVRLEDEAHGVAAQDRQVRQTGRARHGVAGVGEAVADRRGLMGMMYTELGARGWYVDRDCHMCPIIRRDFLTATGLRYPVEMSSGEDLCFLTQVAFSPSATFTVRVAEPNYYYREGESTRAANMAESRVRGARRAIEGTGSAELATLVDTVGRGTQWRLARGDARYAAASRSGERDPGVDDITLNPDPVRGVGQLLRLKAIEAVGRAADHQLRPGIVRDIEGQLAPNDR